MTYRIVGGNKRTYQIMDTDGNIRSATPRKSLYSGTNGLYVGDFVVLDPQGCIVKKLPRRNLLYRPKIANIDFMGVVVSLKEPEFSSFLLDKFLTYLSFLTIDAYIVFTKYDLLTTAEKNEFTAQLSYYRQLGYPVFLSGKEMTADLSALKNMISHKTVAFMGQTGAGKSTLINRLDPTVGRMIGEYSTALGRGKHMTKEVVLIPFDGGLLGDTPGFSSLELLLTRREIATNFPGFQKLVGKCYYNNCLHQSEKDCQVLEALNQKSIPVQNYQNYLKLLGEAKEENEKWKERQ